MTTVTAPDHDRKEPSKAAVAEIHRLLSNGKVGATLAAPKIMDIVAVWETKYRPSLGWAVGTWLRENFGQGASVRFFELRDRAGKRFGQAKLFVEHSALVWLDAAVKEDKKVMAMVQAIVTKYAQNKNVPLSKGQVELLYSTVCGERPHNPRECSGCKAWEAKYAALEARLGAVGGK